MTSLRSTLNRRAFSDGLAPPQLSATLVLTHLFSPSFAFEAIPHELESLVVSLEFLIERNLDFVTQVRPISLGDDGDGGSELPLFVRGTTLSMRPVPFEAYVMRRPERSSLPESDITKGGVHTHHEPRITHM